MPFLTWTIGCEILKDAEGRAAGVLVASRSGTRVIRMQPDVQNQGYATVTAQSGFHTLNRYCA